jgi:hypothetical protein
MTKDEQHTNLTPEIKQACMMLGIAVMSDIRMVVREELKRFGLANSAEEFQRVLKRDLGRPIPAKTTPKTTCGWKPSGVDGCNTEWDEETQKFIQFSPPCGTCEGITAIFAENLVDEDHRSGKYEQESDDGNHPWEWIPDLSVEELQQMAARQRIFPEESEEDLSTILKEGVQRNLDAIAICKDELRLVHYRASTNRETRQAAGKRLAELIGVEEDEL